MTKNTFMIYAEGSCRMTIVVIFLLSSILKSVNIHSFSMETEEYIDLYMPRILSGKGYACAFIVCSMEMIMGTLALKKKNLHIVSFLTVLIMSSFLYLTGMNLFFPTMLGGVESCGCFGELVHFSPLASFVKSAILWVISIMLLFFTISLHRKWYLKQLIHDPYSYICLGMSCILPMYSLFFLENMERTIYIAFYVSLCVVVAGIIFLSRRS